MVSYHAGSQGKASGKYGRLKGKSNVNLETLLCVILWKKNHFMILGEISCCNVLLNTVGSSLFVTTGGSFMMLTHRY